jgi:hypothetical protein
VRPGNGRAGAPVVLVAELDVRLVPIEGEPGAWWVHDLDGLRPPGRLVEVPVPAPWAPASRVPS